MCADASATWGTMVDLGARGRYAEAEAVATALLQARDRWASLAQSTAASHRRQIGDHASALALDGDALARADDAESRADATIGLAADAVATGDAGLAASWHARAADDAAATWRTLTRWHWVGAEAAMLRADPVAALDHARSARACCDGRSLRHDAKSRIILAAVSGDPADLPTVLRSIEQHGWATLAWPLALVADDHPGALAPAWRTHARTLGREATYAIEESLVPGLRSVWSAHPGVRRLRAEGAHPGGE